MAEYRGHDKYLEAIASERAKRAKEITSVIRERLGKYVEKVEADSIRLSDVSAEDLRDLLHSYPAMLKPLLVACNVGQRAVKRDVGMNVNTLKPRLTKDQAWGVAKYLVTLLPKSILIESLVALDLYQWTDSAIRKEKGSWEQKIIVGLQDRKVDCKKRKFPVDGVSFELDVAYPSTGDVLVGVDIKMVGHELDIHKRSDEIVNKAEKQKKAFPSSIFVSVVYYPYDDHSGMERRLRKGSQMIDHVLFAGDDQESIDEALDTIAELCAPIGR